MSDTITDPNKLEELRNFHSANYGKWICMTAGASSRLVSYQGGVLALELRIARGRLGNKAKLLRAVPDSWRNLAELREARKFKIWVYETRQCDILQEVVSGKFEQREAR